MDVAAMASGGDTMAPSVIATGHPTCGATDHHHRRDGQRGREDEANGEEGDRAHVAPELAWRQEEGRGEEDRRKEDRQDQLRIQLDARHAGHQPDPKPGHHHQDRIGDADAGGEQGDRRNHGQQQEDEPELFHCAEA